MTISRNFRSLSRRNATRKGLVHELLNAQDTVLCSCFAQRSGERSECQNQGGAADDAFQGLGNFESGMHEDSKAGDERGTRGQ